MFKHCASCVKEISHKSLIVKIPFYVVNIEKYSVESWYTKNGELVIQMIEKPVIDVVKPVTIQETFEYSRYPGERS